MLASWREGRLLDVQRLGDRALIMIYTLIMGWVDDPWILTVRKPPGAVRRFLAALTEEKFFGEGLKLGRSWELLPLGFPSGA